MKRLSSVLALLLVAVVAHAQLLWRISGKDLVEPSYVFGTYHLAPSSFADSVPGLDKAFKASKQVYGEVQLPDPSDVASMQKMQLAMLLPPDQSLDKLLSPKQYKKLSDYIKKEMGVDLSNPTIAGQFNKLSPAALETQLTMLTYIKMHGTINPNSLLDGFFQKKAKAEGKPVGALETLDFQINVLYKSKPMPRQVSSLICFIDNSTKMAEVAERLNKAYFSRNIEEVGRVSEEKLGNDCDATPEEQDILIYNRNADWARKLPAIMVKGSTLVAVGAAHLPGERGLLQLLRKEGYKVEAVDVPAK